MQWATRDNLSQTKRDEVYTMLEIVKNLMVQIIRMLLFGARTMMT